VCVWVGGWVGGCVCVTVCVCELSLPVMVEHSAPDSAKTLSRATPH